MIGINKLRVSAREFESSGSAACCKDHHKAGYDGASIECHFR